MKEIKVVAAVMKKEGKFYIFQRNNQKAFGGLWEFPGGKIEPGESKQKALARELSEELCIETKIGNEIGTFSTEVSKDVAIRISFFWTNIISGKIFLNEHENMKLIDKAEFVNINFAPADIPILNKI